MLFSSLSGALPRANNDGTTFGTMRMSGERKAPFSSSPFSLNHRKEEEKVSRDVVRDLDDFVQQRVVRIMVAVFSSIVLVPSL